MISLKSWRPDLNPSHNQHTIVQTGLEERTWNASKYFKKFCSGLYELSNLYLTQDLSTMKKTLSYSSKDNRIPLVSYYSISVENFSEG